MPAATASASDPLEGGWTYGDLLLGARRAAARLRRSGAAHATLVGLNSDAMPLLLFGSALAGIPFAPVNYRLDDERLHNVLSRAGADACRRRPGHGRARPGHRGRRGGRPGRVPGRAARRGRRAHRAGGDRRRGHRHPAVHERHHRRAQGRRPAPPPPHRVHLHDRRVHGRRRGRGPAGQRAAVPHRRHLGRALVRVRRAPHRLPAGLRHRGVGARPRPNTASRQAMVVPTMLNRILDEVEPPRHLAAGAAPRLLRRRPDAAGRDRAGDGHAARRPLGQRLRPHRDQLDDRRARPGGPRRGVRQRRPSGASPARLRRPAVAVGRAGDPRRRRQPSARPARRARSTCAASRSPASTSGDPSSPTDGWFPTNDAGFLDAEGYLFLDGRLDDVIVRGAENLSPGEIEDTPRRPPGGGRGRRRRRARRGVGREGRRRRRPPARRRGHRGRAAGLGARRSCARPRPPSASSSGPSCPTTRPASSCAACSRASSPSPSLLDAIWASPLPGGGDEDAPFGRRDR